jgi:repressor LexA
MDQTTPSELTAKQRLIFDYIQSYIEENHVSPSFRDIARHFDVSVGTVQDQVEALRRKGCLEKDPTLARALRIPLKAQQVPILGRVHAGPLHLALENVEGYLPVGATLSPSRHFALKIRGDSMVEAGILEGDLVIVHAQETADDGDIVVARVEDEATVKRLRRRAGKAILEPANPKYQPIADTPFSIAGVVVEVRRHYKGWRK